jgi:hypothetical protein
MVNAEIFKFATVIGKSPKREIYIDRRKSVFI